jgi:hypothetical protein
MFGVNLTTTGSGKVPGESQPYMYTGENPTCAIVEGVAAFGPAFVTARDAG